MSHFSDVISNLQKQDKKSPELHQKYLDTRLALRKSKQRIQELSLSRDKWKEKAKVRNACIKKLKKQHSKPFKHYYLSPCELFKKNISGSKYPFLLIFLSLLFRLHLRLSYRSIAALWGLLNEYLCLGLTHTPCANTIQSWVQKTGLFLLEEMGQNLQAKSCTIIVDESMNLGNEKILLLLALPCQRDAHSSAVLTHTDVEVLNVSLHHSMKAEELKEILSHQIAEKNLNVEYILSDRAPVLCKATALLDLTHIPDITHLLATCLKKTFQKDEHFQAFESLIKSYKKKLRYGEKAYLVPPNIGKKARFMHQKVVADWAKTILGKFAELSASEQEILQELPQHQEIIEALSTSVAYQEEIALIFKEEGLSASSYRQVLTLLTKASQNTYQETFKKHLKKMLEIHYQDLTYSGKTLYCCSDVIESMFGKFKEKLARNKKESMLSQCLEIPTYTQKDVELMLHLGKAINTFSLADIKRWKEEQDIDNQTLKARQFFQK